MFANDVSQLEQTPIREICTPTTVKDVQTIVMFAARNRLRIGIKGQSHCMGGHTLAANGILVDMCNMHRFLAMRPDGTYTVEAGAIWYDVIRELNQYGKSPATLQSYSSFSVGGSIGANIHGITNNDPLIKSVVSLTLVDSNGRIRTIRRSSALFTLVLGGFGLFGIVTDVTLRYVNNCRLRTEIVHCKMSEFVETYGRLLQDRRIAIRIVRLHVLNLDDVIMYLMFREEENVRSPMNEPTGLSVLSQLAYKWLVPTNIFQHLRFVWERFTGFPLDFTLKDSVNDLMNVSATSLSSLYEPLIQLNNTFILQEYFIPPAKFNGWFREFRECIHNRPACLTLLNITFRFVTSDKESVLAYAPTDSIAVVLYFRIRREDDPVLGQLQKALIAITNRAHGTFYLPYRRFYDANDVLLSYPRIHEFLRAKQRFDPSGRFSNTFYEHLVQLFDKKHVK